MVSSYKLLNLKLTQMIDNNSVIKTNIKVEIKYYDGIKCDFLISENKVDNGIIYGMAKMFPAYFASLKLHPYQHNPKLSEIQFVY
jgi:hypothetical protein